MRLNSLTKAGVSALTLAILAITLVAPAAEAGHRRDRGSDSEWRGSDSHGSGWSSGRDSERRWKGRSGEDRAARGGNRGSARVVEIHRSSSAGPILAGIIGGVALGAILSNSGRVNGSHDGAYERGYDHGYQDGTARADYDYYDPYCEETFSSFDACRDHERDCRHPRVIQVIATDSGRCVGAYNYRNGGWRPCEAGDWSD
jgi:hypothetical protein